MVNNVFENEKWWQVNGAEWMAEVEDRRETQLLYKTQELMICDFLRQIPKNSRVLEFGTGFGRHARYINQLENVEYYGVDQSPTMLKCLKDNVENTNNLFERVTLIEPRVRLPFDDNYFDVVFTVSVLIHIKPEHIRDIIKELMRVSKYIVFNFENKLVSKSRLEYEDHNGCWKHALKEKYSELGYDVQVIQNISASQDLYFINKVSNNLSEYFSNNLYFNKLKEMTFTAEQRILISEGEIGWKTRSLEEREATIRELEGELGWKTKNLENREAKIRELEGEVGWKTKSLENREAKIRELEGELGWKSKNLEDREAKIRELEGEVGWKTKNLEKRESTIRELEGEVGWKTKELLKNEEKISFLEGEVGWRSENLLDRENQICEFKEVIERKSKELGAIKKISCELENEKNKYKDEIESIKNEIEEKKSIIIKMYEEEEKRNTYINEITAQLKAKTNILNDIYNSNSWKLIQRIKENKIMSFFGKAMLKVYKKIRKKDMHLASQGASKVTLSGENKGDIVFENSNTRILRELIKNIPNNSDIAVCHNDWMGVKNSTKELFENVVHIRELTDIREVEVVARSICDKEPNRVIFSGFASGWNTLCKTIKGINPNIETQVYWHGNTTHMYEDYSWIMYQELLELYRNNELDRWAFAKESMQKLYESKGVNAYFLKNHVSMKENTIKLYDINEEKNLIIGIYASGNTWNKNAYTQIAAASLFEDSILNMVPYNERMKIYAEQLGCKVSGHSSSISREQLMHEMKENHINFYVTFSECAPLLPLESLNQGVLCLTGPNHHYFKGSKLEEFLVVNRPDDPVEIHAKAVLALKNRSVIMKMYQEWYDENMVNSQKSLESFESKTIDIEKVENR